jgi:hypothetical protein
MFCCSPFNPYLKEVVALFRRIVPRSLSIVFQDTLYEVVVKQVATNIKDVFANF